MSIFSVNILSIGQIKKIIVFRRQYGFLKDFKNKELVVLKEQLKVINIFILVEK